MQVIKKSRRPRLILLLAAMGLLVLLAGGFALWKQNDDKKETAKNTATRPVNKIDYSPASTEDNQQTNDRKNNPDKTGSTLNTPSTPPPFSVTITRATVDNSNKQLVVGTLINGSAAGKCTFNASRAGQPNVTAVNQVVTQGNAYSCPNFMIPFSEFPVRGEWKISVTVDNGKEKQTSDWSEPVAIPEG